MTVILTDSDLLEQLQKSLVFFQFLRVAKENGYKFVKLLSYSNKIFLTEMEEPVKRNGVDCFLVYEYREEDVKRWLHLLKTTTQELIESTEWKQTQPKNREDFNQKLLFCMFKPKWRKASQCNVLKEWKFVE